MSSATGSVRGACLSTLATSSSIGDSSRAQAQRVGGCCAFDEVVGHVAIGDSRLGAAPLRVGDGTYLLGFLAARGGVRASEAGRYGPHEAAVGGGAVVAPPAAQWVTLAGKGAERRCRGPTDVLGPGAVPSQEAVCYPLERIALGVGASRAMARSESSVPSPGAQANAPPPVISLCRPSRLEILFGAHELAGGPQAVADAQAPQPPRHPVGGGRDPGGVGRGAPAPAAAKARAGGRARAGIRARCGAVAMVT